MSYIVVIVTALAISAGCVAIAGRSGVRIGFLVWIGTLGLGYRTVSLSDDFRLHPSAVVLSAVFLWLVLTASSKVRTIWWAPAWLLGLVPFMWWGWIVGFRAHATWDRMLTEFHTFALFLPLFVVAATVLDKRREWKAAIVVFYGTASFVAIMGLIEYIYPGVRNLLPGFVSNIDHSVAQDGFERAQFSFWGHQAATFICALALPFCSPILRWIILPAGRLAIKLAFIALLAAVYVGGFRVLWLFVTLQAILWFLFNKRYGLGLCAAAAAVAGYSAFPAATQLRIQSFLLALQGTPVDTSSATHLSRVTEAIQAIRDYPAGLGWTGAGWVHSDFLQIAANLGLVPGMIYAGAYLSTAFGLWNMASARNAPDRPFHLALLLSFLTAGGIMCTQVIYVLPQLACPVWFVWALAAVALRQRNLPEEANQHVPNRIRVAPHLQLRGFRPAHSRVR